MGPISVSHSLTFADASESAPSSLHCHAPGPGLLSVLHCSIHLCRCFRDGARLFALPWLNLSLEHFIHLRRCFRNCTQQQVLQKLHSAACTAPLHGTDPMSDSFPHFCRCIRNCTQQLALHAWLPRVYGGIQITFSRSCKDHKAGSAM